MQPETAPQPESATRLASPRPARLWASLRRTGIKIIILSLLIGLGTLAVQLIALIRTGIWTNYTLLDLNHAVGWTAPHDIGGSEDLDFLWDAFLHEGSLALAFILYLPLIVLLSGFALWQLALLFRLPIGAPDSDPD